MSYTFNTDRKTFFISTTTSELGFHDLLQANFVQQWVQASLLAKVIVITFAQEVFMEKRNLLHLKGWSSATTEKGNERDVCEYISWTLYLIKTKMIFKNDNILPKRNSHYYWKARCQLQVTGTLIIIQSLRNGTVQF